MDLLKLRASGSMKTSFPSLQAYSRIRSPYQETGDSATKVKKLKPETSYNGNTGFELLFLDKKLKWGVDYFYSRYEDKITRIFIAKAGDYIYRNVDAAIMHGMESTLMLNLKDVLGIADIDLSLTYTYIFAENQTNIDSSDVNKGEKIEKLPEHKFTFDFRTHFKTKTSLIIFGYMEYNQIMYAMRAIPATTDEFSRSYFHAQKIHNPLMIDVKVSQKIYYNYEVYVMCRNILDDYAADPLNPGPGRMWYGGTKVRF
jgi:outer membrane receptor protein involved in Fe transport